MQPLDFLAAVLPSSGVFCAAEFNTNRKEHVFVDTLDELKAEADAFAVDNRDVYFALAAFKDSGSRTGDNARVIKSLFIDIDIGDKKDYKTRADAKQAYVEFVETTGMQELGRPIVVSSGGGFHMYWPFTQEVEIARWKPLAENFKRLCKQEGFNIDWNCTADAARVLRVPGTFNQKFDPPKPVKILDEGTGPFSLDALVEFVDSKLKIKPVPTINLPGQRPTRSAGSILMMDNNTTLFKNILVKTEAGTGCGQLAYYLENAQQDGMEPLWRGLLSWTKHCDDGEKANSWLTKQHPYDQERMEQKLREIKGPYGCLKIDSINPGICPNCSHYGKITNALILGREVKVDNTPKEVVLEPQNAPITPNMGTIMPKAGTVMRPTPPRGFSYGEKCGVYRDKTEQDGQGNTITTRVAITPYDLFVVNILRSEGEHIVHLLAVKPEGPEEITLPQRAVVSQDETVKALAQQNIIASFGKGNDRNLFDYVRACVEEASYSRAAINVPTNYGWQPNDTFVYNERVFSKNMPPQHIPMRGLVNINKATKPTGSLDEWRKIVNMLTKKQMHEILAMSMTGFAAPLMRFTGYDGITFHLGSTESGTGKSLTLELAASVWGHPVKYRVSKNTSDVAMQQRLGLLHSMPLISDEITSKNRKDFEWFPGFIFDMAEGQGKDRMESGANKERENTTYWKSIALLSSNTHVIDYLTGARRHSSEGEIRRLLELTLNKVIKWEDGETEVISNLRRNYGVAGELWAQYLVDNMDTCQQVLNETKAQLKKEFKFTDDERYWLAGCSAKVASAILVGSNYAGIVDLPIQGIIEVLKGMVEKLRKVIKSNFRSAEDVLNAYIRENYGKFVVVKSIDNSLAASFGDSGVIDQSITRSEIFGRVEHNVTPGYVDFFIEESLLKQYCSSMSFGYADFKVQMEAACHISYMKKDLMSKTKGPQMRVNAMKISRKIDDEEQLSVEAA
jgi:hypothetical protein